jgi:hypothetical protein
MCPHTTTVTAGTLEEMHWDMLPQFASPDMSPSNFHLFGSLKEVLGKIRSGADDEVKLLVQQWMEKNHKFF